MEEVLNYELSSLCVLILVFSSFAGPGVIKLDYYYYYYYHNYIIMMVYLYVDTLRSKTN